MHEIQIKIYKFLEEIKQTEYKIPEKLLAKFGEETQAALKKQFERKPRDFKLSMSNAGRPLCQLMFEKLGVKGENNSNLIRNTYGDLTEKLVLFLLYASGINVISQLERTSVNIKGLQINGEYDVILDLGDGPKVWDIKSASDWAFKNKYTNITFEEFWQDDTFGYVPQLILYSEGLGIKAGGWIVNSKSTGEIGIVEVPDDQTKVRGQVLEQISNNVTYLSKYPFTIEEVREVRSFKEQPEIFRKTLTGNKVLNPKCTMCDFKWECWPELQLKQQAKSTAKNRKMVYYTEYNEDK